jgi:hypothetical protein
MEGRKPAGRHVGEIVEAEDIVAYVDSTALLAPIGGALRGLTRDGVPVTVRTKVIEVRSSTSQRRGHGTR